MLALVCPTSPVPGSCISISEDTTTFWAVAAVDWAWKRVPVRILYAFYFKIL